MRVVSVTLFSLFAFFALNSQAMLCSDIIRKQPNDHFAVKANEKAFAEALRIPKDFTMWTAKEKLEFLWRKMTLTEYKVENLPKFSYKKNWKRAIGAFFQSRKAFSGNHEFKKLGRIKFIHPEGSVAKFRFTPSGNKEFTGLLSQPVDGIMRLSPGIPSNTYFLPGAAFKFLVTGQHSISVHAMPRLEGQGSNVNYFHNTLSNKIPMPKPFALKAGAFLLRVASLGRNPLRRPIDGLSQVEVNGMIEKSPHAPRDIEFVPTARAREIIDPASQRDFRENLLEVPAGTELYTVVGVRADGTRVEIGKITTQSAIIPSRAGDNFRFRHQTNKLELNDLMLGESALN